MIIADESSQASFLKYHHSSASGKAIFIGALVAVGLGFLVYLLVAGLGLSLFTTDPEGLKTIVVVHFIILFFIAYLTMFAAGWVAGVFAKPLQHPNKSFMCGGIHGFAAWCLAIIISVFLHSSFVAANLMGFDRAPISTNMQVVDNNSKVVATNANANSQTATSSQTAINVPEKAINIAGIGVLATFFIFLIGAIGSWMGGYMGFRYLCNCRLDSESKL